VEMQKVARLIGVEDVASGSDGIPAAGPDDILVRVSACGICGTDLGFYREGSMPSGTILGHEFSGRLVTVGSNVGGLAPGQRVVVNPTPDGVGLGRISGAFAQYVRLTGARAGHNVFALPDSVSDELGALVEPFAVGMHAVNRSGLKADDRIVIYGAGTIGLCVLAALRARGARNVLVVDLSEKRLELARALGTSAVHNARDGDARAFVGQHYGEEELRFLPGPVAHATLVFECAGAPASLRDAMRSLAPGGRLMMVADPHGHALPDLRLVMIRELTVIGAMGYENEFPEVIDLLDRGVVDLTPLITHRYQLDEIAEAFRVQMNSEAAVKVLVLADD
jgi:2-desacetyl-2-hydroxyethyl bacteriochlorophyllide A dehydrogenase